VLWDEIQVVLDILDFARTSTDEMETEVERILSELLEAFDHKKQGQNKVILAMAVSYACHITSCLLSIFTPIHLISIPMLFSTLVPNLAATFMY
jgi:hypothetical protein